MCSNRQVKITYLDRVAEQNCGCLLLIVAGIVGNFASMIEVTHNIRGFHGAVSQHRRLQKLYHRRLQKTFYPIREYEAKRVDTVVITSCTDLRKAVSKCLE